MPSVDKQIPAGNCDARSLGGDLQFNRTGSEIGLSSQAVHGNGGFVWTGVNIPIGATITAAKVSLFVHYDDDPNVDIHGNDVDDANNFEVESIIDGRARTSASVPWAATGIGTMSWHDSPDIASIIQEIINRAGWLSGNSLCITIIGRTSPATHFYVAAYGVTGVNAAKLHIEYTTAGPTAPAVTALPASAITSTTARLNGEVTDNGGENPTVHIYWGTSDGETTPGNWDHDENLGVKAVDTFYKDISGLTRGTKYYYRCYAENSGGSVWSNAIEFTTLLEKPVATSNAATGVGVSAATLNGTATDDGGGSCQYRFRYKKASGDYLYTTWAGAKATGETFSEGITGLDASSTYYFNAQVKNSQFESDWGAGLTFDTGAAVVAPTGTTDAATLVADVGATLNGTVTGDGGEACEVRFQYGLTAAYGTNTAWQPGKLTSDTFSQVISGLTPNATYHFRAQIKNSDSTADGADETFTTEYFPTPFIRRVLRDMFGGGADINAGNPLPVDTSAGLKVATEILDEAEIIAGATTALGDCDAIDLSDGDRTLAITLEATYDGGAAQGIKIHVRTSHDGTNWDTIDW